jgi:hypothetical protein
MEGAFLSSSSVPSKLNPLFPQDYTPQRLLPPYTQPEGAKSALVGEELIENLLEKADVAVVISAFPIFPLFLPSSTDVSHLQFPSATLVLVTSAMPSLALFSLDSRFLG